MTDNDNLKIVLAGQGNAGKSSVFNFLTGLHQHIGNWAGKTIEKREGTLFYKGHTIDVLDLPGIYSLTTYSVEEIISREYIVHNHPDFVINVIDSTNLERNLIFTLQLLELECPVILALNMIDLLNRKKAKIDVARLKELLHCGVIPTIAVRGSGLTDIIDRIIEMKDAEYTFRSPRYGKEIENCIEELSVVLKNIDLPYPERWLAIKLIEKDIDISDQVYSRRPWIREKVDYFSRILEDIHGHDSSIIISDERSHLAARIVSETVRNISERQVSLNDRIDAITSHRVTGYIVMLVILGVIFLTVFSFGNWVSGRLDLLFMNLKNWWSASIGVNYIASLGWAAIESILALVQIALPYILPFYVFLYILEDWGYIARISFLMDNLMHKMGIHGKACISFIIGFGCNVPGCLSCRIMESKRERFITAVLVTLIPCSAVSVIIFGLVGKFVGIWWALGLYLFATLLTFVIGKISSGIVGGEPVELIMPMPDYKTPHLKTIGLQTWHALREFVYIAAPLVIISGVVIQGINLAGWMPAISSSFSPITVNWLGLPSVTGILLIFGILRKELILVMLAAYMGTSNFSDALTSTQMITLAVVSMFYVPCVATISVLWKDYGWKKAMTICLFEILFAIILAGIVRRILDLIV